MSPPSSVRNVARRSSSRTPSARRRSQSALPPGNTYPRSRGPSKSPPVMGTVRRVPWGTAPMLCGVATVTRRVMSTRMFITRSLHKGHQFGVYAICVRPAQTVWTASNFGELDVLDHLGLPARGRVRGQNAIGVAVDNQCGNGVLRNVWPKILHPGIDALQRSNRGGTGGHVPVVLQHAVAHELSTVHVVVVEVLQEVENSRRPVRADGVLEAFEHTRIDSLGVVGGLDQIGPKRADQHRLAHPVRAVLADISRNFTGSHREPDECHVS